jgi:hypothetical protein
LAEFGMKRLVWLLLARYIFLTLEKMDDLRTDIKVVSSLDQPKQYDQQNKKLSNMKKKLGSLKDTAVVYSTRYAVWLVK